MKTGMKRILCGVLMLALVLGMLPGLVSGGAAAVTASNVAAGKSVSFGYGSELVSTDSNYSVAAVNAGTSVLTDGVNDSPNWWVNNGNPYVALKNSIITGPYIFSVDLGAQYDAQQVRLYSYGRPDWGVYPVEEVTFTISADGTTWQTLGTVALADAAVNTIEDPRYEGSYVDIYCFTLDVTASGRYVRATFPTNSTGLVGIGEIEVYGETAPGNISTGATVSYFGHSGETGSDANWGSSAVNSGLSILTDGETSSPNWWVNNGNPNIGLKNSVLAGPYVFNLDLGTQSNVRQVSTFFYSRTDWNVDAPDAVTYSVSTDGISWTEVGGAEKANATATTITDSRNPDDQAPTIYQFALNLEGVDARYVKVTFNTNSYGIIGLQEIQVLGTKKSITNLALGRMANSSYYTYDITGGGTGYEATGTTKSDGTRYTVTEVELASASRLTDGTIINASAVTYPSSWASQSWNSGSIMGKYLQIYRNDSRIITLDLGAVRNITGIRMHFAAVESMGFYMPTNVTYYLSEDGENYYEAADVWNYQSTADSNDSNISCSGTAPRHEWYAASGINYNARFVKVIFPVNVYILSDELQVFGCETMSTGANDLTACPKYDPLEKYVGHYATVEQSGGVKNEFMAYSGWYINSDGSEVYNTYKTQKEYMCAIAYVDANGTPTDWLFDDVTVMGHYYTSSGTFNSYKAGYTSGSYYADKDDWYEWLCYAFGKDANGNDLSYDGVSVINLEALEAAAASAKTTLNDPDYKVGVKLVLFPAVEYQNNWGTLNGKNIDFTISGAGSQEAALANRAAAYQWYVDTAVEMWENAGFEHLELTGFYYYEETIHESTDRIAKAATQALTDIVHTHATPTTNTRPATDSAQGGNLRIYQLPFYQSEGYWNWAEYGFDYALMQPNYSFYDMYTLTQLEECGNLCKYYGLGMQMEFGGAASTAYHEKFEDYLTYGDDFGYQNAVLSWYMSTWGCINMATDTNGTRYLYDMVYEFVKTQNANLTALCTHSLHTVEGICHYCAESVEHTYEDGSCTVCGAEDNVHKHSYTTVVTTPTCTEAGYTTYTCDCGDSYIGDEVAATGHSYTSVTTAPTCTVAGYTTYTCACGDSYFGDEVAATGHSYDAVVTAPTCTEAGSTTYTCSCGDSYTETIPATGHSYDAVITAPSCTEAGYTTYTCDLCGDSYIGDEVEATGHSYDAVITAPTCTVAGYTTYTCACGDSYIGDEVAATGHSYDAVVTAPTCTEAGSTTYTCACGDTYTETIAATGHSYVDGVCTGCGEADPDNETEVDPVPNGTITLKSVTLSLEDEIVYNLYYEIADMTVSEADMGMIIWDSEPAVPTINGGGTVIEGATYVPSTGRYGISSMGIPAKNMGDLKYMVVYAKQADGSYVYSKVLTYSAKTYCLNRVQKSTNENMRSLCVALMNYGAAAQEYFGYKTDSLMNEGFEDYQDLVAAYDSSLLNAPDAVDADKTGTLGTTANGFTKRSVSMSADGTFALNYYFTTSTEVDKVTFYYWTAEQYAAVDALTLENASGSMEMTLTETANKYWANYEGIAAKDMDKTIYACGVYEKDGVTYCTGVISYSLAQYCINKAASESTIQPLAAAMAVYGYQAKIYFGA